MADSAKDRAYKQASAVPAVDRGAILRVPDLVVVRRQDVAVEQHRDEFREVVRHQDPSGVCLLPGVSLLEEDHKTSAAPHDRDVASGGAVKHY